MSVQIGNDGYIKLEDVLVAVPWYTNDTTLFIDVQNRSKTLRWKDLLLLKFPVFLFSFLYWLYLKLSISDLNLPSFTL